MKTSLIDVHDLVAILRLDEVEKRIDQMSGFESVTVKANGEANTMTGIHRGWRELHPDVSLNFHLNRWAACGGEAWSHDVEPILPRRADYDVWRDEFLRLGEAAEREGRLYIAGLHFRSAEVFMLESDARKQSTRLRLLAHLRQPSEGTYTTHPVPFGNLTLTAYRFGKPDLICRWVDGRSVDGTGVCFSRSARRAKNHSPGNHHENQCH